MKCALRQVDMYTIPPRDFAGLMSLYESNYIRLRNLVPDPDLSKADAALAPLWRAGLPELAARLDGLGEVSVNEFLLRADIRDGDKLYEITLFDDGRAIIKGTQEPDVARGIYSKYVGT